MTTAPMLSAATDDYDVDAVVADDDGRNIYRLQPLTQTRTK